MERRLLVERGTEGAYSQNRCAQGGVGVAWGVSPLPCKAILKYEEKNGGLSCTFGRNLFLFHIF